MLFYLILKLVLCFYYNRLKVCFVSQIKMSSTSNQLILKQKIFQFFLKYSKICRFLKQRKASAAIFAIQKASQRHSVTQAIHGDKRHTVTYRIVTLVIISYRSDVVTMRRCDAVPCIACIAIPSVTVALGTYNFRCIYVQDVKKDSSYIQINVKGESRYVNL